MVSEPLIFNDDWLRQAESKSTDKSWASDVVESLDTTGQTYLTTLRLWFEKFPLAPKYKQGLRVRLESLQNNEHLGVVNELSWWAFMLREGLTATPLSPATTPRPDFQLQPPADCFVEVSTLNVSDKDKSKFESQESIALDHAETIKRVVGKLTAEKQQQLKYARNHNKPSALALFDYTAWSGFDTLFFRSLGEFLLGKQFGYNRFPPELSAIVYLERKVLGGRIALSRHRSAVYYNPLACYPLPANIFPSLNQFSWQLVSRDSRATEQWLFL